MVVIKARLMQEYLQQEQLTETQINDWPLFTESDQVSWGRVYDGLFMAMLACVKLNLTCDAELPKSKQPDSPRLDQFFKLRISTNLLISQFLEIANDASQGSGSSEKSCCRRMTVLSRKCGLQTAVQGEADASFDPYQSFISTKCSLSAVWHCSARDCLPPAARQSR